MKNTFVIQKAWAQVIKLEQERMHAYPLGIMGRGKKEMFVKGMDCKIQGCMNVCVCLCEGMDVGLGWRRL